MARSGLTVLFDIGGTHTRIGIAENASELTSVQTFETDPTPTGPAKLAEAVALIAGGRQVRQLVGGIAGQVDRRTGILHRATNLTGWNGISLTTLFSQRFEAALHIENDAALVGLGEAVYGAGRGHHIVMYETVSTGVNAARIVGGRIEASAQGVQVGEQLILAPDGRLISLEAATGGAALERTYGRSPDHLSYRKLWRSEAKLLALGLYNSLVHWSPDVVIMGGPMMRDIRIEDISIELDKLPHVWPVPIPIVHATLGDVGGLYGALALAGSLT